MDIHVDLDPLLKSTLRQIASILERLYDQQQAPLTIPLMTHRSPWTREFYVSMSPNPTPKQPTANQKRIEDDWLIVNALVLADNPENEIARAMADKLSKLGARVDISTHATALEQNLMRSSDYSHFYNILPRSMNVVDLFMILICGK